MVSAKTNLTFVKEGENGTNGTDFVCKIVPNGIEGTITPQYPTLTFNEYTQQYQLNYTQKAANKWFKAQLWHDGELIYEGTESGKTSENANAKLQWMMLQNNYGNNKKDDSNFTIDKDTAAITFNTTEFNNPANIVKCVINYNNVDYYATLPITIVRTINDSYDIQLVERTGFRDVMYTTDGQSPAFDNQPFELVVSQIVDGIKNDISHFSSSEFAVDYNWEVKGNVCYSDWQSESNLIKNTLKSASLLRNQISYKPVDTYNGLCVTNALVCNITRGEDKLASIHIPIHFYINRYGNAAMNGWDGNSISLDENGTTILAPQIGAGSKNDDNTFTGVFMGSVKEPGATKEEHGLFGYNAGQRTITLNSEDGSARFGKAGAGQIIIDPTQDTAQLKSGDYVPAEYNSEGKLVKAGSGMLIDLTEPKIEFGSGKFTVDKDGNVVADSFATREQVEDLENSISHFSITTHSDTVLISCTADNKPLKSSSYTIVFYGKFKGQTVTNFTEKMTSGYDSGIITKLGDNQITFTVDSTKAIQNAVNVYKFEFTYTDLTDLMNIKNYTVEKEIAVGLAIQGKDGYQGSDGKSAYEVWLEAGNTGSEQDYLNSLKGEDGDSGKGVAAEIRYYGLSSSANQEPLAPNVTTLLPLEYGVVDYIENIATQAINLDFYPKNQNTKMEVKAAFSSTSSGQLMGSGSSGNARFNFGIESSRFRFGLGASWFDANQQIVTPNTQSHTWILDGKTGVGSIDGFEQVTSQVYGPTGGNTTALFARGVGSGIEGGNRARAKIYYAKIWDDSELVRDLVPCIRRADSQVGMYDLVNRKFYTDPNGGNFNYEQSSDILVYSTTVPTMTETNKYLWSYSIVEYTDGTFLETDHAIIGVYGNTGNDGAQGPQGEPGKDGEQGPKGDDGYTPQKGVDYFDGKDGEKGEDGTGVTSIITQYYLHNSSTSAPSETVAWQTSQPTWTSGKYIWTREEITWSDGNTTHTNPILADGLNKANQTAANADSNASSAVNTANTANTNANQAKQDAATATSTANTASQTASNALEKANAATSGLSSLSIIVENNYKDLQGQIDGAIATWFYDYDPNTENTLPTKEWTTETLKDQHLGDLFYIVDNEEKAGQCFRYAKVDGIYKWIIVEDVEVAKAIADAANAQATADGKATIFTGSTTPSNPQEGDLWMKSETDGILTYVKQSNGTYVWKEYNKYTDDALAQAAKNTADSANTTAGEAKTAAQTATNTANTASQTANAAKEQAQQAEEKINTTVKKIDVEYASSTSSETPPTTGWSTDAPKWVDGEFIWSRNKTTYVNGTSTEGKAVCITGGTGATGGVGPQGPQGPTGGTGPQGVGVKGITELYFAKADTTAPSAPTIQVTTNSATAYDQWNQALATYNVNYPHYFTCSEILYTNNTRSWSAVVYAGAITSANQTANSAQDAADSANTKADSANTKADSAVSTANTAKTTADSASSKADTATSTANSASSKADAASSAANKAQSTADQAKSDAASASSKADSATSTANAASSKADAASIAAGNADKKAQEAKDAINNLDVGGRNLILASNEEITSEAYLIKGYSLSEEWQENTQYSISIKGSINSGQKFGVWAGGASTNVAYLEYNSAKDLYAATFTTSTINIQEECMIYIYNCISETATSATISKIKLEKGNVVTDWTPAPEDGADVSEMIISTEVQYCLWPSASTAEEDKPPETYIGWTSGLMIANLYAVETKDETVPSQYLWTRIKNTPKVGEPFYTEISCVIHAQKELVSQDTEYILSAKKDEPPGKTDTYIYEYTVDIIDETTGQKTGEQTISETRTWSTLKPELNMKDTYPYLWSRLHSKYKFTGATTDSFTESYTAYTLDSAWGKMFSLTDALAASVEGIIANIMGGYVHIEGGSILVGDDKDNPHNLIIINHKGIAFFDNPDGVWPGAEKLETATSTWDITGKLNMKDILVENLVASGIDNQYLVLGNDNENGATVSGDLDIYDSKGHIMFETITDANENYIDAFKIYKYNITSSGVTPNGYILLSRSYGFQEFDAGDNLIFGNDGSNMFSSITNRTTQQIITNQAPGETKTSSHYGIQIVPMKVTNAGDGLTHSGIAFLKY